MLFLSAFLQKLPANGGLHCICAQQTNEGYRGCTLGSISGTGPVKSTNLSQSLLNQDIGFQSPEVLLIIVSLRIQREGFVYSSDCTTSIVDFLIRFPWKGKDKREPKDKCNADNKSLHKGFWYFQDNFEFEDAGKISIF